MKPEKNTFTSGSGNERKGLKKNMVPSIRMASVEEYRIMNGVSLITSSIHLQL